MGYLEKDFNKSGRVLTLDALADLASSGKYPRLSLDDEEKCTRAWQNDKDESALTRLLIDKSLLILQNINIYAESIGRHTSREDIYADALYGVVNSINDYPLGTAKAVLNTYIVNGAKWNIMTSFDKSMVQNSPAQHKARTALKEAGQDLQRELTTTEELKILENIAKHLKNTYHSRKLGSVLTASDLSHDAASQHPSIDDQPNHQYEHFDGMDWVISDAQGPYEITEQQSLQQKTNDIIDSLTSREKTVLRLRYGIGLEGVAHAPYATGGPNSFFTLKQVGSLLDVKVSVERVRQIEAKALRKLRYPSRQNELLIFQNANQDNNQDKESTFSSNDGYIPRYPDGYE